MCLESCNSVSISIKFVDHEKYRMITLWLQKFGVDTAENGPSKVQASNQSPTTPWSNKHLCWLWARLWVWAWLWAWLWAWRWPWLGARPGLWPTLLSLGHLHLGMGWREWGLVEGFLLWFTSRPTRFFSSNVYEIPLLEGERAARGRSKEVG